jgi:ATP-dependent DNA helicase RecQ
MVAALASRGHRARGYHAGMTPEERQEAQEAFASERADIVVATVAFGMGIDRSNVRFVIHAGMPKSIEHYQQEAGRAGRDGLVSECVLLHDAGDAMTWMRILEQSFSDDRQLGVAAGHLEAMNRFCLSDVCRHRALVEHFGGNWSSERCDACDLCLGELETVADSTTIAQKILSCVVRTGQTFGAAYVSSVLRGERSASVLDRQHDTLSTFGLLSEHRSEEVRAWIAQLVARGALVQEGHSRPVLRLGPAARAILRGDSTVRLLQTSSTTIRDGADEWARVDRDLFEALRTWRRDAAAARNVAPFVILGDRTLRDLAAVRPSSAERLRAISGIGEVRLREHGRELMQVIDTHCAARKLDRDLAIAAGAPRERPRTSRPTAAKTEAIRLLREGSTIEEVMERTGRARSTVVGDLCEIIEDGRYQPSLRLWMTDETEDVIRRAAAEAGIERLKPIREIVGESISYDEIHIVVATIRAANPPRSG